MQNNTSIHTKLCQKMEMHADCDLILRLNRTNRLLTHVSGIVGHARFQICSLNHEQSSKGPLISPVAGSLPSLTVPKAPRPSCLPMIYFPMRLGFRAVMSIKRHKC